MRIRCSLLLEEKYAGFHFILFSCSVVLKFCSDLYVFLFDFLMVLPVEEVDFLKKGFNGFSVDDFFF
jgi:hypothetical protein